MSEIARPRQISIVNPVGGCVAALDMSVLEHWTTDTDEIVWSTGRKNVLYARVNGTNVTDAVIAHVSYSDMQKVGCHWLEGEEEADATVAAHLLFVKLKKAGYTTILEKVVTATRTAVISGAPTAQPRLDVTLNPPIGEV